MTVTNSASSRSFKTDQSGTVAVTFGLMFVALMFVTGVALDFGRLTHTKSKFAAAADAAALAGGRALVDGTLTDDDVRTIALNYFRENVESGGNFATSYEDPEIIVDRNGGGVTINAAAAVDMTITSILGYQQVFVPVSASTGSGQGDMELSIQLDLTGSMCQPCSKIDALKEATADLIETLLPDGGTPNTVRIAMAPFASGVNAGTYAGLATGNRSRSGNCVYDRPGDSADSDAAPAEGRYFKGNDDLPGASGCPTDRIVTLTDDKDALLRAVRRFRTSTTTAGQLGTNWAWNLISPNWKDIWPEASKPADYRDGKTKKAVILMTDGEYNTFDGACDTDRRGRTDCDPNGTRGRQSNEHAKAMCENMKAEGIVVYTVGFQIDKPTAVETLSSCATSMGHYFSAEDAEGLKTAFRSIALELNDLRLTN